MPQLGLGLRANVSGSSLYDGDAAAYFTRAGVTDATAKAQINEFVKGVKNLGIWSSFICWPLKSSQNAGSGTTVYSLGGFGPFNGSFVSSPTWGVDGITFNGSNSISLSTSIATGRVNRLAMGVGKITAYDVNRFLDIQDGTSNTRRNPFLGLGLFGSFDVSFSLPNSGVSAPEAAAFVSNLPLNTYYSVIGRTTSGSMFVYRDKSLRATLTGQTFNQGSTYTAAGIGVAYQGTISFVALGGDDISEAQLNSLNDLYASTLGGNLDLDADSYILRAGVTDPTAKTQINDFVVGIKGLGLWNDMICWPLRSTQNAGTGSTAYSLGGFGTYNGTLVNSPTWGTNGITFTSGSSQKITVPSFNISKTDIILATCQAATSGNLRSIELGLAGGGIAGIWAGFGGQYYWDCRSTAGGSLNRQNGGSVPTSRIFTHGIASTSGASFFVNGTSILSNAVSSTNANINTFELNQNGGNGNISFAMFSQSITGNASLYNLYKTTLGTGLGLP